MIYLDNAATSFPKPDCVCDEMLNCMKNYCGNPGRSGHSLSVAAAAKVFECREVISAFFSCNGPENIIFTQNATHALNMLIKGVLRRGDHVLISDLEHNSVLRPIYRLAQKGFITYDIFPTMTTDPRRSSAQICTGISKLIKPNTRMLICAHCSNICSSTLPIREIGNLCRRRGLFFAVDGAQSAGHITIDMKKMNIDALCAPGHKGLLGPAGSGFLALNSDIILDTLTEGGNGVNSLEADMPDFSPDRYETGTLAIPAIAGLCEGVKFIDKMGTPSVRAHIESLYIPLRDMLGSIPGVKIYAPEHVGSVLLFNVRDIPSDTVSRTLSEGGICTRSGFHCAPLAHTTLGTPQNGAVRAGLGVFNTKSDIEALWREVKKLT